MVDFAAILARERASKAKGQLLFVLLPEVVVHRFCLNPGKHTAEKSDPNWRKGLEIVSRHGGLFHPDSGDR